VDECKPLTDGKYPGSQVKMLIHMVFKVERCGLT
jgi:hypothetical protein